MSLYRTSTVNDMMARLLSGHRVASLLGLALAGWCSFMPAWALSSETVAPLLMAQRLDTRGLIVVSGRVGQVVGMGSGVTVALDEVMFSPGAERLPREMVVDTPGGPAMPAGTCGLFFLAADSDGNHRSLTSRTPAVRVLPARSPDDARDLTERIANRLVDTLLVDEETLAGSCAASADAAVWARLEASQWLKTLPGSAKRTRLHEAVLSTSGYARLLIIADLVSQGELDWIERVRAEMLDPPAASRMAAGLMAYQLIGAGSAHDRRRIALDLVNSEDPVVKSCAAEALQQVAQEGDRPRLTKLLTDPDETVRWSAASALARLRGMSPFSLADYLANETSLRRTLSTRAPRRSDPLPPARTPPPGSPTAR
ncbi:MAG: HEAT repeat domain-containing protein [Pseudomonadota bacterium]